MTAKTTRKQLSIFLSIAIASSTAQAQPPSVAGELSLDAASGLTLGTGISDAAVDNRPPSPRQLVPAQPASQPTRIERSILETPRISSVPVVTPEAEIQPQSPSITPTQGPQSAPTPAADASKAAVGSAELIRGRFPNGKPQVERWVAEDAKGNIVNHGKYVEYDVAGTVIAAGNYVFGRREGEWSKQLTADEVQQLVGQFDKKFTAPFSSRATFKSDQLDGEWTISDAHGKPLAIWSYKAGARQGLSTHFDQSGEVTQSINYEANLADGPARMPAEGGVVNETSFNDGMMLRQVDKWHPAVAGKTRVLQAQEWHLVPMPLNVASSEWASNRVEYRPTTGIEPIRHGMSVTFYPNGQRESEGSYDQGKRTGTFAWWYPNGQQKTVGEYRNDLEHDAWTWWHENGMKHASGTFADGRRVEEWSLWSAEGKLVKRSEAQAGSQVAGRSQADEATQKR